jgi:hypothetical protein
MRAVIFMCALRLWFPVISQADLFQWTDAEGVIHIVDETTEVPEAYRAGMKVYRAAKPTAEVSTLPVSPSRTYAAQSQGAFAQKIAFDLGLIKRSDEDALGPLRGAGIQPAGGWQVGDPLTVEVLSDVQAASRRAAEAKRLPISADGAEAVVRQAGESFLPSPPPASEETPPEYILEPQTIIIEQPPAQIVEVIREPDYYGYLQGTFVGSVPGSRRHRRRRGDNDHVRPPAPLNGPFTPNPAPIPGSPTHMPFGTTHMPFGTTHMPFGSSRAR